MLNIGWRTVVIENRAELSLDEANLCVKNDSKHLFPISQLKNIIVATPMSTVSVALMNELSRNNVNVLFCDNKRVPQCEMVSSDPNTNLAGNIRKQIAWSDERKAILWQEIVREKIQNQENMLRASGLSVPEQLSEYRREIEPGDPTNREAQAARLYFSAMFGNWFPDVPGIYLYQDSE